MKVAYFSYDMLVWHFFVVAQMLYVPDIPVSALNFLKCLEGSDGMY